MKKLLSILFLCLPILIFAQKKSGNILFTEKMTLNIKLPPEAEAFKHRIPKERVHQKELIFNESASIYKNVEKEEDEDVDVEADNGRMRMRMMMMNADNQMYRDVETGNKVEKRDFFGKTFLIKDEADKHSWKVTTESKEILGYNCLKAVIRDSSLVADAWFTTEIPVSSGPHKFGGLPGMVLEVSIEGERPLHIIATEVNMGKVAKSDLVEPKKGKVVTQEEMRKIMKEKREEMRKEMGGRGGFHPRGHE